MEEIKQAEEQPIDSLYLSYDRSLRKLSGSTDAVSALQGSQDQTNIGSLEVDSYGFGTGGVLGNVSLEGGYIQSANYVSGTSGWQLTPTTAEFNQGVLAGELHIPDEDTTANSFHVQSDGDTFWGTTSSSFDSDNDNASAYVLKDGTARFDNITLSQSVNVTSKVTLGEDVSSKRLVYAGSGANELTAPVQWSDSSAVEDCYGANWCAQAFTTGPNSHTIAKLKLNFKNIETDDVVTVRIRDSLTGSNLSSSTYTATSDHASVFVTFSGINMSCKPSTEYFVVISIADNDAGNEPDVGGSSDSGDRFASAGDASTSSDSGSSWGTAATVDAFYLVSYEIYTQPGRVYLATSYDGDAKMTSCVGLLRETGSKGDEVEVQIAGNYEGFTDLIPGVTYYLDDAITDSFRGEITPTAPSNLFRAGVAVSDQSVVAAEIHDTSETCQGTTWQAQSFVIPTGMTKIGVISFWYTGVEDSADSFTVKIRSSIDGADLYESSGLSGLSTGDDPHLYVHSDVDTSVTAGGTYYIVFEGNNAGGATDVQLLGNASSEYASGSAFTSSDSGSTWAAASSVADFAVTLSSPAYLRLTLDLV